MSTNSKRYNSGAFPDIIDGIKHSYNNIVTLPNVSYRVNYLNQFITEAPSSFAKEMKHILMSDTYSLKVTEKMKYNPEYIAETVYGTPDLWYIVLLVNNFLTPYKIVPPSIKVSSHTAVENYLKAIKKNQEKFLMFRKNPKLIDRQYVTDLGL